MHNIQYISKTIGLISKCKKVKIEIKGTRDRGEEKLNIRCDNTVNKNWNFKMVYILYLVAETECMRSTEFSVEKSIGINSRSTEFSVENKKGITRFRKNITEKLEIH